MEVNESDFVTNLTSNHSVFGNLEDWNNEIAADRIPNTIILCLYMVIGVTGNLLVVLVYKSRTHMQTDNRYFILFLAELDLVSVVVGVSYSLYLNFAFVLPKETAVCKILRFSSSNLRSDVRNCFVVYFHTALQVSL